MPSSRTTVFSINYLTVALRNDRKSSRCVEHIIIYFPLPPLPPSPLCRTLVIKDADFCATECPPLPTKRTKIKRLSNAPREKIAILNYVYNRFLLSLGSRVDRCGARNRNCNYVITFRCTVFKFT
ncbi:hypothetical protein PUN28_008607 [Cardiocondyla obscurior]|uniref:Uncharacterized protein n=1 Tax=Cardiocondyla obscurior TaxID=286306 RepID=A0AAW2G3I7_9HYME